MKTSTLKRLTVIAALCLAACSHNSGFKKASPQVTAATNMQLAIEYLKLGKLASSRNSIELALSDAQMEQGLMFRRSLAPNAGMLFDFRMPTPVMM